MNSGKNAGFALVAARTRSGAHRGIALIAQESGHPPKRSTFVQRAWGTVLLVALIALGGVVAYHVNETASLTELRMIASEHGLLEVVHTSILLIATLIGIDAYRRSKGAARVGAFALAMVTGAGLVREVEVKSWSGPDWFIWLTHHGLQEVLFVCMTVPIAFYLIYNHRYLRDVVRMALRWESWPLYFSGVFILLSIYLDERVVYSEQGRLWEELIETYGYCFLAMAVWRHRKLAEVPEFNVER